jgi:glycosyltransferase involved in cell wall biosynthesis
MSATIKIQIVSRYVPVEYHAGHFTYLLDLLRYLHQCGYQVELDLLDPWFQPERIPLELLAIADVVIMPAGFLQTPEPPSATRYARTWLRPLYRRLPFQFLQPLRRMVYHVQGKTIPGLHNVDAVATEPEIAFIKYRFQQYAPDVMIANETFLGNLLSLCKDDNRALKVSIAFDLHHQRSQQFQQAQLHGAHSEWDRQKEIEQLQDANVVLSIHAEDARTLKEMVPHAEILCVPMPAQYHVHDEAAQIAGRCLFVGSSIEHNVHGLRWFLRDVWPIVLQRHPDSTVHVCGTVSAAMTETYPNVRLLGRIDDIHGEYAAAEVCIIPLLVGSGLKIKLVEALSHGRACVSTSVGIQGLQELADRAVLVTDTPEEFANAIIRLLKHPEKRKLMEEEARWYVIEHLSPEKSYRPFVEHISQHVLQKEQQHAKI